MPYHESTYRGDEKHNIEGITPNGRTCEIWEHQSIRVRPDRSARWDVIVGGIKSGTIGDDEHAKAQLSALNDRRLPFLQTGNLISGTLKIIIQTVSVIPTVTFWVFVFFLVFDQKSTLEALQAADASAITAGFINLLALTFVIAIFLRLFLYVASQNGLRNFYKDADFRNYYEDATDNKIRQLVGVPINKPFWLVPASDKHKEQ